LKIGNHWGTYHQVVGKFPRIYRLSNSKIDLYPSRIGTSNHIPGNGKGGTMTREELIQKNVQTWKHIQQNRKDAKDSLEKAKKHIERAREFSRNSWNGIPKTD
jgi:hypothetical protein